MSSKVLHIINFDEEPSRVQELLVPMCKHAKNKNHQILLVSRIQPMMKHPNLHWLASVSWLDPRWILQFYEIVKSLDADVFHVHGIDLLPNIIASLRRFHKPTIVSILHLGAANLLEKTKDSVYRQTLRWVDIVTVSTRAMEQNLLASGIPPSKVVLFNDAAQVQKAHYDEMQIFEYLETRVPHIREKVFGVGIPGAFRKHAKICLKALSEIPDEERPILFLFPKDFHFLKEEIQKQKLKSVVFELPQDRQEIVEYAHFLWASYGSDQFDPFFFRAYQLGKVFLAPFEGAFPEYICSSVNGYLVSKRNSQDWKVAFQRISQDWAYREKLAKGARHSASSLFSIQHWLREHENLLFQYFSL